MTVAASSLVCGQMRGAVGVTDGAWLGHAPEHTPCPLAHQHDELWRQAAGGRQRGLRRGAEAGGRLALGGGADCRARGRRRNIGAGWRRRRRQSGACCCTAHRKPPAMKLRKSPGRALETAQAASFKPGCTAGRATARLGGLRVLSKQGKAQQDRLCGQRSPTSQMPAAAGRRRPAPLAALISAPSGLARSPHPPVPSPSTLPQLAAPEREQGQSPGAPGAQALRRQACFQVTSTTVRSSSESHTAAFGLSSARSPCSRLLQRAPRPSRRSRIFPMR